MDLSTSQILIFISTIIAMIAFILIFVYLFKKFLAELRFKRQQKINEKLNIDKQINYKRPKKVLLWIGWPFLSIAIILSLIGESLL
ncbi:hypothetical protein [Mycoplasma sp. HU2014]|uniref:hypothetical protein n=1 Tax=Mycoplasma sp. HU2014 TaxID=1664275 RepID=UPI00067A7B53|nr:hypothetical protein [Mycoplasma sp. HU2014]KNG79782.1 hypothetical protein AB668_02220 [Mycoplasma sp. HU2014]